MVIFKHFQLILFLFPFLSFSQSDTKKDSLFLEVPLKDGQIIYEKVFFLDSTNNKDIVFNAAKTALIRNANYKYAKIDEDRNAGSISSDITFGFIVKPGIAKLGLTGKSILSIDVKENRFRVRIFNNMASVILMNTPIEYVMLDTYQEELLQITKGKWKSSKSIILNWHEKLSLILEGFGVIIKHGIGDDF